MPEIDTLRLAASGASITQIADHLRVTPAEASDRLRAAISQAVELGIDRDGCREIELTHLDMLRAALVPSALKGDIAATRMLIRIHASRAAILGLTIMVEPEPEEEEVDDLERIRLRRADRQASV